MIEVSVILPVFNKANYLSQCLESLGRQTQKNMEIIVVDDGNKPKLTVDNFALKETLKTPIILLRQEHKGAGAARNLGVKQAKGKILVFIDADMYFEEDFVADLVKPIAEGVTKGTFSKEEFVANWNNAWARCWNYNFGLKNYRKIPENFPKEARVFRAILTAEFKRVNGFDAAGYNDDWTLAKKLGYKAALARGAVYYHFNPQTLGETLSQAKWRAKREYKYGFLGELYHLFGCLPPVSLLRGLLGTFRFHEPDFFLFALVFDIGYLLGLLEKILFKNYY